VREPDTIRDEFLEGRYFRVGTIREPCSYYLSLYQYGRSREAGHWLARDLAHRGFRDRFYGGEKRPEQFRDFLLHILGFDDMPAAKQDVGCGYMSLRVWTQLIMRTLGQELNRRVCDERECEVPPVPLGDFARLISEDLKRQCHQDFVHSHVLTGFDCWLHMERSQDEFRECVERFVGEGGLVNQGWESKIDSLSTTVLRHPVVCKNWYDEDLATLIERMDGPLARKMGYSGKCCDLVNIGKIATDGG